MILSDCWFYILPYSYISYHISSLHLFPWWLVFIMLYIGDPQTILFAATEFFPPSQCPHLEALGTTALQRGTGQQRSPRSKERDCTCDGKDVRREEENATRVVNSECRMCQGQCLGCNFGILLVIGRCHWDVIWEWKFEISLGKKCMIKKNGDRQWCGFNSPDVTPQWLTNPGDLWAGESHWSGWLATEANFLMWKKKPYAVPNLGKNVFHITLFGRVYKRSIRTTNWLCTTTVPYIYIIYIYMFKR